MIFIIWRKVNFRKNFRLRNDNGSPYLKEYIKSLFATIQNISTNYWISRVISEKLQNVFILNIACFKN